MKAEDVWTGPKVAVFREEWLAGSETFIRNQSDALSRWTPLCLGLKRRSSAISRPTDEVVFRKHSRLELRRKGFKLFRRSARLRRLLRSAGVDLIHAHFGMDGALIAPTAKRLGIPLVVTFHGVDVTRLPQENSFQGRLYRRRLAELFRTAETLICVSDFLAGKLRELGAPAAKVRVEYIGIPVSEHQPPTGEKHWDAVFVGRLEDVKGCADLIRALALLAERGEKYAVAIAGHGALRESLAQLAVELGVEVSFLGALTPAQVAALLDDSKVLVGPSKTMPSGYTEAFGLVFLEAAAHAIPSVAYRSGGVPEAVLDGVTGLLAAEGDVGGLAERLSRLLTDPQLSAELGQNGRQRVRSSLDVAERTRSLEQLYDQALKSAGHSE